MKLEVVSSNLCLFNRTHVFDVKVGMFFIHYGRQRGSCDHYIYINYRTETHALHNVDIAAGTIK